ncbi:MAG: histidine phosphatase family protein [Planctomycetota bacterium]
MKLLLLMRHAHAEDRAATDFDRPLSERGRQQADAVGTALAEANLLPEVILASAALRTTTTAELVAARLPHAPAVQTSQGLYCSSVEEQREALRSCGAAAGVLLIAHNPGVAEHLYALSGSADCPPATCVAFEVELDDWAELSSQTVVREVRRFEGSA